MDFSFKLCTLQTFLIESWGKKGSTQFEFLRYFRTTSSVYEQNLQPILSYQCRHLVPISAKQKKKSASEGRGPRFQKNKHGQIIDVHEAREGLGLEAQRDFDRLGRSYWGLRLSWGTLRVCKPASLFRIIKHGQQAGSAAGSAWPRPLADSLLQHQNKDSESISKGQTWLTWLEL